MQCHLGVKILDLDGCAPKYVHEFSERLVVCLSQTSQGGRGHAVRLLVAYCTLNHSIRVLKLSMDLGGSPWY